MPILELQQRARQLGEIRIGQVVPTSNGKTRPEKLDRFRLTSPSRPLLEQIAALYGGTVRDWTPANGGPSEFEVLTEAKRLPILVPPQSVSLWYEHYSGSACERRCDGVTEQKTDSPCLCDPDARTCKPTTRLNVVLRDVPGVGVWLLTSRGYYAASELPQVAELLARAGGYVSAWLSLEERVIKKLGEGVKRFMVPTIEVDVTPAQLLAGNGAVSLAAATEPAAITTPPIMPAIASRVEDPAEKYRQLAAGATTPGEVRALWGNASNEGVLSDDVKATLTRRADELKPQPAVEKTADNPDSVWMQIIGTCPEGWSTDQLEADFQQVTGVAAKDADTAVMRGYLNRPVTP